MYLWVDQHLHHCIEGHLCLKLDTSGYGLASRLFYVLWGGLVLV
jgi:hypothetical protein